MKSSEQSPPSVLYHYTTQTGVLGILESKCIWATEIRYLNDASEFIFFVDMVKAAIEEARGATVGLSKHEILSEGVNLLSGLTDLFREDTKFLYFVASFTAHGDLLSQWRAYSRDDIGYSIGFSSSKLQELARLQDFSLKGCVYDYDQQRQILHDLFQTAIRAESTIKDYHQEGGLTDEGVESINSLLAGRGITKQKVIDTFLKKGYEFGLRNAALFLARRLLQIGQGFKHHGFREESEWRVISSVTPITKQGMPPIPLRDLKFRVGKHMIIPYTEFKLTDEENPNLPIEEIIVGPTPHEALARASVEALLSTKDLPSCKVKPSLIPYRPT